MRWDFVLHWKFTVNHPVQVEERLKFYDSGEAPRKNIAVMEKVASEMAKEVEKASTASSSKKKRMRNQADDKNVSPVKTQSAKKKKKKTRG